MYQNARGNSELVRLLLSAEADTNARDHSRRLVFFSALSGSNLQIAVLLVGSGAGVDAPDTDGVPVVLLWEVQEENILILEM